MRKIHLLGLALMAVLAVGATTASSALGAFSLAQWLVGGALVHEALAAVTEGELLLENTKKGAVLCSGILVGTIGPESSGSITEVQTLSKVKVETELKGTGLLCTAEKTCEPASEASPIEVWPDALPWSVEVELELTAGTAWVLIFKAGWDLLCLVLGIMVEELCTAAEGAGVQVVNGATDVEAPNGNSATPNGNCGTETGVAVQTSEGGLTRLLNGETLQVSE